MRARRGSDSDVEWFSSDSDSDLEANDADSDKEKGPLSRRRHGLLTRSLGDEPVFRAPKKKLKVEYQEPRNTQNWATIFVKPNLQEENTELMLEDLKDTPQEEQKTIELR